MSLIHRFFNTLYVQFVRHVIFLFPYAKTVSKVHGSPRSGLPSRQAHLQSVLIFSILDHSCSFMVPLCIVLIIRTCVLGIAQHVTSDPVQRGREDRSDLGGLL